MLWYIHEHIVWKYKYTSTCTYYMYMYSDKSKNSVMWWRYTCIWHVYIHENSYIHTTFHVHVHAHAYTHIYTYLGFWAGRCPLCKSSTENLAMFLKQLTQLQYTSMYVKYILVSLVGLHVHKEHIALLSLYLQCSECQCWQDWHYALIGSVKLLRVVW